MIEIFRAELKHLELLVPLFDAYRVFYEQESDLRAARAFLKDRLNKNEATVFIAMAKEQPVGFTLLYDSFSSVSMLPVYILNDLYVAKDARKMGIGEALLNSAKNHCREQGYKGLALETAMDNPAQRLYERLNWKKDSHCFHYFWEVD